MRVHRLISILLLIDSKGKIKAKELADKLETSVRTIYRDIDILSQSGIPITTTTGPDGGIHFIDGYSVGIDELGSDEMINLYLSSMGIIPHINSESGLKLNNTLLKLEKKLPSKYYQDIQTLKKHFYFDETPWWEDGPKIIHIDSLIKSVFESFKLKITYQKVNGDVSIRVISPYGLVVKRMDWYLIAYCEESKGIRLFKCERMTDIKKLDESFLVPINFKIDEYWNKSEKGFKTLCTESEVYQVKIKLNKDYANIIKNFEVYEIKQDHQSITVTINLFKYEYACHDIMEFIGCCEVIEPIELRNYVKQSLKKQLTLY